MKIKFISIVLLLSNYGYSQSIERFSIDSGGDKYSSSGIQILNTIGEAFVQERSSASVSISEGFIVGDFKIKINPIVFLQGPLQNPKTAELMNDDLRIANLIHTTSPFLDSATCHNSVFLTSGPDAIIDWVWVELRDSNAISETINGKSALLQRDGDIVAVDGVSSLIMNAPPKDYYIVINHRNHIGVMSGSTISLLENTATVVDFTNESFSTFGDNSQVVLTNLVTALWSGDSNGDDIVSFSGVNSDTNSMKDYIISDAFNFLSLITFSSTGYLIEDANLDGLCRFTGSLNDSNIIKDNVLNHPDNILNLPTYTFSTNIPTLD